MPPTAIIAGTDLSWFSAALTTSTAAMRRQAPSPMPTSAWPSEPDDHEAGADLDLSLPLDEGDQQTEGRITTSIASRWPTVSGQSAATRPRELLSISPAETGAAIPSPGSSRDRGHSLRQPGKVPQVSGPVRSTQGQTDG
jgi:hypothetical protein